MADNKGKKPGGNPRSHPCIGKRKGRQYRRRYCKKQLAELKAVLADKYNVLIVCIGDHYLDVVTLDKKPHLINIPFFVARKCLRYRLFYKAARDTLVNLHYFKELICGDKGWAIVLPLEKVVILGKTQQKNIKWLNRYLNSKQYITDLKRGFPKK